MTHPLASPDGGDTPRLLLRKPILSDMIHYFKVARTLKEWSAANARYINELHQYNSMLPIVRRIKNIGEPKAPGFKCLRIMENVDDVVVVELRCYGGITLACRAGDKGFSMNLINGEITPLLGSRGKNVGSYWFNTFCDIFNEVRDVIIQENIKYL